MRSLLLLLLTCPYFVPAQDFSSYAYREFTTGNTVLPYRILFPEPYNETQRYPLVVLLHGGGERGNDNEKQLTHGASLFLEEATRSTFPCIVVVPQCPEDNYWASVKFNRDKYPLVLDFNYQYPVTAPLQSVVDLIHKLSGEERIDLRRVYIMGLSMGGMGTLEAVFRNPGLFAAAVAICGGGDTRAYSRKQAKVPFWLFHGDADGVIGVDHSRDMVRRLKELKADVKYTEYKGVNHNSWENAFKDPDLLPWLFSKRR